MSRRYIYIYISALILASLFLWYPSAYAAFCDQNLINVDMGTDKKTTPRTLGITNICATQYADYGKFTRRADFRKHPALIPSSSHYRIKSYDDFGYPTEKRENAVMECSWEPIGTQYFDVEEEETYTEKEAVYSGSEIVGSKTVTKTRKKIVKKPRAQYYRESCDFKWKYWQLTTEGSTNLSGWFLSKYLACGNVNPTPGASLTLYSSKYNTYMWDDEPPKCEPVYLPPANIPKNGTDVPREQLEQVFAQWKSESSIVYKSDRSSWDGTWTQRDLILRTRCNDRHSGCKPEFNEVKFHEDRPLHNRQKNFSYTEYQDKVHNYSESCSTEFMSPSKITKDCQATFYADKIESLSRKLWGHERNLTNSLAQKISGGQNLNGVESKQIVELYKKIPKGAAERPWKIDAATCVYGIDGAGIWGNKTWVAKYALIDRVKPTIEVKLSTNNPNSLAQQSLNGANFYAGEIPFTIKFIDNTPNTISSGISGIKSFSVQIRQIEDYKGTKKSFEAFNKEGAVDEDLNRRSDEVMDRTPSEKTLSSIPTFYKAGKYTLVALTTDWAGNVSESYNATFTVHPNPGDNKIETIEKALFDACKEGGTNPVTPNTLPANCVRASGAIFIEDNRSDSEFYADAKTKQAKKYTIVDKYFNPIYERRVTHFANEKANEIRLNQIDNLDNSGDAVITEASDDGASFHNLQTENSSSSLKSTKKWQLYSRSFFHAPGKFTPNYTAKICSWTQNYTENCAGKLTLNIKIDPNSTKKDVYHIFTGKFIVGKTGDNRINLGTRNDASMEYTKTQQNEQDKPFTVKNFAESIRPDSVNEPKIQVTKHEPYVAEVTNYSGLKNTTQVQVDQIHFEEKFLKDQKLKLITDPEAKISLQGLDRNSRESHYYISPEKGKYGKQTLGHEQGNLNRIFIEWIKQTIGKEKFVTDQVNLSHQNSISPAKMRNLMYKNAAYLTRNVTGNQRIGSVITISAPVGTFLTTQQSIKWSEIETFGIQKGDTIIIKGYSLFIDEDIETPVSLAVLQADDKTRKDVRIAPDVVKIAANIFVDGSIISVKSDDTEFGQSNTDRVLMLQKQIVFLGKIFSQNTVGGAVLGPERTDYVLPTLFPQKTTRNIDEAVKYDLSFLRMNNAGAGDNSFNKSREEAVVILDDKAVTKLPSRLFDFRE